MGIVIAAQVFGERVASYGTLQKVTYTPSYKTLNLAHDAVFVSVPEKYHRVSTHGETLIRAESSSSPQAVGREKRSLIGTR